MRRCSNLLLSLVFASLSQAYAANDTPMPIHIPFTLKDGLPTVDAILGGRHVALFIDIGSYKALGLSLRALSAQPAIPAGETERFRDSEGKVFTRQGFRIKGLRVGELFLPVIDGVEMETGEQQDGTLGYPAFRDYLMVFNFPGGLLSLYPLSITIADLKVECGSEVRTIQFLKGVIETRVQTEKGEYIFQFDTGSKWDLMRPSVLGVDANRDSFAFSQFAVLGQNIGRTRISLREFTAPEVDGVLGTEFLGSRILCLDMSRLEASIQ